MNCEARIYSGDVHCDRCGLTWDYGEDRGRPTCGMKIVRPTVREIIEYLASDHDKIDYVTAFPGGQRITPDELWLPRFGIWLSVSVGRYSGGGTLRYFGWFDRWRLRRAFKAWDRRRIARLPNLNCRCTINPTVEP